MDSHPFNINAWQILGHDWAIAMLREHLISGQARHAYLFTGPSGIGKRTLALRFIQGMNCPQPVAPGVACMQPTCRTCRQIWEMQHADLKIVRVPEGKSEIPIDMVRELQSFLMLAPYEAPYKVGLLLNFEQATVQSQNALLKILEEAPPRARLLITADSAESVLATIASRCELLRLRPLASGQVGRMLQRARDTTPEQADLIDHLAAGRYGFALRLLEDTQYLEYRQEVIPALLGRLLSSLRERFRLVEESLPVKGDLTRQREAADRLLLIWQSVFRDMLLCKAGNATGVQNIDFKTGIETAASRFDLSQIELLLSGCNLARERIDRYCNIRLVLEDLVERFDEHR